ncbi:FtsX-like permease family protein [Pseudoalteromonas sp. G4]|uniref:FtsX-like permease family protein n=1 Tax=Pseudoalteromonas sp. G4 TaxID=2992761 RepID=UPI00237D9012|nr:FtsX-like permease family protein [Pseudoalteromonas sp. G4]MDE3270723.1 ABC transporter permease [Pseudoalteromonas sp. G4]
MSLSVYLVKGFRRGKGEKSVSGFFSKSSTIGISLGVAVLILALSVINGFEFALKDRLLSVIPHIEYYAPSKPLNNFTHHQQRLLTHPEVKAVAPYIKLNAMVSHKGKMHGVVLKGINPSLEQTVSKSADYITPKSSINLADGEVVLGKALAEKLALSLGDTVTVLLPEPGTQSLASINRINLTLAGTINLGGQLDMNFGQITLGKAQQLKRFSNAEFDGLQVKVADVFAARQSALSIGQSLDELVYIETWYRSQGNLYQDIQMVRLIVYITVFLIVAVASFNIVSTLVMEVKEKQSSIAILKTMGANDNTIIKCFLLQGIYQAAQGLFFGLLFGILLSLSISDIYEMISRLSGNNVLSGVYFIDYLPSQLKWVDLLITSAITFLMAIIACIFPAIKASKTDPAKVLGH